MGRNFDVFSVSRKFLAMHNITLYSVKPPQIIFFFYLIMQIRVATISEANQKLKKPYNRLTVIYDENTGTSEH